MVDKINQDTTPKIDQEQSQDLSQQVRSTSSQSKSPYIMLGALSILVISTLVVVSFYFVRPDLETQLEQLAKHNLQKVGVQNAEVDVTGKDVVLKGEVDSLATSKKAEQTTRDTCGIQFIDNQLLVRNSSSNVVNKNDVINKVVKNQAIE